MNEGDDRVNSYKEISSLFNLAYLSEPHHISGEDKLIFTKTTIDPENDGYVSSIKSYDVKTSEEKTLLEGEGQFKTAKVCGNHLLYLSNDNAEKIVQAYVLNLKTNRRVQVTQSEYPVHSVEWVKEGKIAYITQVNQEAHLTYDLHKEESYRFTDQHVLVEGRGFYNDKVSDVLVVQSIYQEEASVVVELELNYHTPGHFTVSKDGETIYYENRRFPAERFNYNLGIFAYDIQTETTTELTKDMGDLSVSQATVSPNGQYVLALNSQRNAISPNHPDIMVFDVKEKTHRLVTTNLDVDFNDHALTDFEYNISGKTLHWCEDSASFYTLASIEGESVLLKGNLAGELERVSPEGQSVRDFTVTENNRVFATISSPSEPIAFYAYTNGEWNKLALAGTDYSDTAYAPYEKADFIAEDGQQIPAFIVKPANFDENKTYPFLINIHGGPNMMHAHLFYHEIQHQAANGYVVLLLNPRGSYGYGQEHVMGSYGQFGEADAADVLSAVDQFLEQAPYIDQERLFITGGSYGGYMTNWIIGHDHRFRAAVSQRCVSNLVSMVGTSDISHFFWRDMAGVDLSDPKRLWEQSPLAYVQNVETPVLLIHSTADYRTPLEQAQQYYHGLKYYEKEAELLLFPGENHGLSRNGRPSFRLKRLDAMMDWFSRYDQKGN